MNKLLTIIVGLLIASSGLNAGDIFPKENSEEKDISKDSEYFIKSIVALRELKYEDALKYSYKTKKKLKGTNEKIEAVIIVSYLKLFQFDEAKNHYNNYYLKLLSGEKEAKKFNSDEVNNIVFPKEKDAIHRYIENMELLLSYPKDETKEKESNNIEKDIRMLDKQPMFKSCPEDNTPKQNFICFQEKIMEHVKNTFRYPKSAKKKGIQEKIYVSFIISSEGEVKDAKAIFGMDSDLIKEAVRIVNELPDFTSPIHNGEKVAVSFLLPITFRLN